MTNELDRAKVAGSGQPTRRDFAKKWAGTAEGMVAVRFDATFLGELTPNTKEDATQAALSVGVTEIDPTATQEAVITGGITGGRKPVVMRGSFVDFIPINSPRTNTVQRRGRSNFHIVDAAERPLNDASKAATITEDKNVTPKRKMILTVFSEDSVPDASMWWFVESSELDRVA